MFVIIVIVVDMVQKNYLVQDIVILVKKTCIYEEMFHIKKISVNILLDLQKKYLINTKNEN